MMRKSPACHLRCGPIKADADNGLLMRVLPMYGWQCRASEFY